MTKEIVGFTFAEVPLEEAINAVIAGGGNYSELKSHLLNAIPKLTPDKAFAFGLPNGKEVPEDQRRGICVAVNSSLKKAKILWKVTYSGTRKLFICIPKKTAIDKPLVHANKKDPMLMEKILALRTKGLGYGVISKELNVARTTVRSYLKSSAFQSNGHGLAASPHVIAFRNKVIELAKEGLTPTEIGKQLNEKMGRVNAVWYKYVKSSKSKERS